MIGIRSTWFIFLFGIIFLSQYSCNHAVSSSANPIIITSGSLEIVDTVKKISGLFDKVQSFTIYHKGKMTFSCSGSKYSVRQGAVIDDPAIIKELNERWVFVPVELSDSGYYPPASLSNDLSIFAILEDGSESRFGISYHAHSEFFAINNRKYSILTLKPADPTVPVCTYLEPLAEIVK